MRWSWVLIGALALLGSAWLVFRVLIVLQVGGEWTMYAAHIGAGAVVGATVARHAEVKPWREPLVAVLLGYAAMMAMLVPLGEAWLMDLSMPIGAAIVAGGAVAAVGAATIVRTFAVTAPTRAALVILSAQLLGGLSFVILVIAAGLTITGAGGIVVMMLFATVLGGFLTQVVTPVRRVWSCGAGGTLLSLIIVAGQEPRIGPALIAAVVFWLLGTLGAVIGWQVVARHHATTVEVPSARLQ